MASNDIRMRVLLNVEGKQVVTEVTGSVKELPGALSDEEVARNEGGKGVACMILCPEYGSASS